MMTGLDANFFQNDPHKRWVLILNINYSEYYSEYETQGCYKSLFFQTGETSVWEEVDGTFTFPGNAAFITS